MPVDLSTAKVGDTLHLANGHTATVLPSINPSLDGLSRHAVYHHPTDDGWNGAEGDWDLNGTKQCPGKWPDGSDVVRVSPANRAGVSRTVVVTHGDKVREIAGRMVTIAVKEQVTVHATFNDVGLVATAESTVGDIIDTYHREIDHARIEKYGR